MQENRMEGLKKRRRTGMGVGDLRRRLLWVFYEVLWGGAAYLFGCAQLPLGIRPLGMGLLCAVRGHFGAVLIGLIFSVLSDLQSPIL